MLPHRWIQILHRSGWEFWLPLPLIAALFWSTGNLIAQQVLSRPHDSINPLEADTQLEVRLVVTVVTINAEIDRDRNATRVFVRTTDSTLKNLEYEFPVVEVNQIEGAIAQELGMTIEDVRRLVSYRIKR